MNKLIVVMFATVISLVGCGGGNYSNNATEEIIQTPQVACTGYGQDTTPQWIVITNLRGELIPLFVEGSDITLPGYDASVGTGKWSDRVWSATPTDEERWIWANLPNSEKTNAKSYQSWQWPNCLSPRAKRAQISWDQLTRGFRDSTKNPRWVPSWMNSIVA